MIQVLLFLLKLIGIVLLALLLLLVAVLLLVLLVPVRYRARVVVGEAKPSVRGRFSWLFPVLWASVDVREGKLRLAVRLFGIRAFSFPNEEVGEKKPDKKKKKRDGKKKADRKRKDRPEQNMAGESGAAPETAERHEGRNESGAAAESEEKQKETPPETVEIAGSPSAGRKKSGFFHRMLDKIRKIWETVCRLARNAQEWAGKVSDLKKLVLREDSRSTIVFAFGEVKRLLRHLLPTRLTGTLVYGSGDPCTTGQALGAISVLYARFGELLSITPVFEEKRFECDVEVRGRIRFLVFVRLAVKLLTSRGVRSLKSEAVAIFTGGTPKAGGKTNAAPGERAAKNETRGETRERKTPQK